MNIVKYSWWIDHGGYWFLRIKNNADPSRDCVEKLRDFVDVIFPTDPKKGEPLLFSTNGQDWSLEVSLWLEQLFMTVYHDGPYWLGMVYDDVQ